MNDGLTVMGCEEVGRCGVDGCKMMEWIGGM